MESSSLAEDKVELLMGDIMYVERHGAQTERSLRALLGRANELAAQLRRRRKPVLVLNHACDSQVSEGILNLILYFDFDRIAVYGTSKRANNQRDLMLRANGLEGKIVSFRTRNEALAWLHAAKPL